MDGIELQDREFLRAIRDGDEPNSSINDVLSCYETLGRLQRELDARLKSPRELWCLLWRGNQVLNDQVSDHLSIHRAAARFDKIPTEVGCERVRLLIGRSRMN